MGAITPSMRLLWMAAANPNPLPPDWIERRVAKKPATLETDNSRESFAVCDGAKRGLFHISGWTTKQNSGGNIYSLSYPHPKQTQLL